jgi:MFS family permease
MDAWGWRIPFLLGGILGPVGLWMRRTIDETPAYQEAAASAGRRHEDKTSPWLLAGARLRLHHRVDGVLLRAAQLHADWSRQYSRSRRPPRSGPTPSGCSR